MRNTFASFSGIENFLRFMKVGVTGFAIGNSFDILDYFMLDFHVTQVAFDFIFEDVLCMHQIGVFVLFQPLSFPVAFITVFSWNFSISYNRIAVAFVTGELFFENKRVVES
jgi:hypothetical protein